MPHDHASFPDEPLQLEIRCTASKPLLSILRRFVSCVAEQLGFSEEEMCMIEMAVDEARTKAGGLGIGVTEAADDAIGLRVEITADGADDPRARFGRLEDAAMLRASSRSTSMSTRPRGVPRARPARHTPVHGRRQIRTCPESGTTVILPSI